MEFNTTNPKEMFCYTSNEKVDIFDFEEEVEAIEIARWLVTCPNVFSKMEEAVFSDKEGSLIHLLREFGVGERVAITFGSSFYIHIPKDEFIDSVGGKQKACREAVFAKIVIEAFLADYVLENYFELICEHQKQFVGVETEPYDPDFDEGTEIPLKIKLRSEDKERLLSLNCGSKNEFFSLFQAFNRERFANPGLRVIFEEEIPNLKEIKTGCKYYDSYCGFDNLRSPSSSDFETILEEVLSDEQISRLEKQLRLFDKGSLVRSFSSPDDFVDTLYNVLSEMDLFFVSGAGNIVIEDTEYCFDIGNYAKSVFADKLNPLMCHYSFYYDTSYESWTFKAIDNRTNTEAFRFNVFDIYCNPEAVMKQCLGQE